jgi:Sulfotransferase domain
MKDTKVFCLGFHKTGTTSLRVALQTLGYTVAGYNEFRHLAQKADLTRDEVVRTALAAARKFDAAQDSPWPVLYRELDAAFPGSKFIHVRRNPEAWIASAVADFGDQPNQIRRITYGTLSPRGNEAAWLDRYARHNAEAQDWFKGRLQDYLPLDLDAGEVGWERICPFLGEPVPDMPWPHVNSRRSKKVRMFLNRVVAVFGVGPQF